MPRNARSSDRDGYFPMKSAFSRVLCVANKDADSPNTILDFFGSLQSHEDFGSANIDRQLIIYGLWVDVYQFQSVVLVFYVRLDCTLLLENL